MGTGCRFLSVLVIGFILSGAASFAQTTGQRGKATQTGYATFYASSLQGNKTASGTAFDNRKAQAAHRTYPFGTVVRVTNLENQRVVTVVIVDRGPFGKNRREGAIIDLSQHAARALEMIEDGQVRVKIQVLKWGRGLSN